MSSDDRSYEEKRDFIRMFVDAVVKVTDPETNTVYQGDSKNLSAGGVAFQTDKSFEIGQKLSVQVSSVQSKLAPLRADFIVKRSDDLGNGLYEIAGSIENVQ